MLRKFRDGSCNYNTGEGREFCMLVAEEQLGDPLQGDLLLEDVRNNGLDCKIVHGKGCWPGGCEANFLWRTSIVLGKAMMVSMGNLACQYGEPNAIISE